MEIAEYKNESVIPANDWLTALFYFTVLIPFFQFIPNISAEVQPICAIIALIIILKNRKGGKLLFWSLTFSFFCILHSIIVYVFFPSGFGVPDPSAFIESFIIIIIGPITLYAARLTDLRNLSIRIIDIILILSLFVGMCQTFIPFGLKSHRTFIYF